MGELTITYNSKGGTAVSNDYVNTGASISSAPTAPSSSGYTFGGWSATDGGAAVTFPYEHLQTANFTLYAIWSAIEVTPPAPGGAGGGGLPPAPPRAARVKVTGLTNKFSVTVEANTSAKNVVVKVAGKTLANLKGSRNKKTSVVKMPKGTHKVTVYIGKNLTSTKTIVVK